MGPRHGGFDFNTWASACGPGFRFRAGPRRRRRVFERGDLKYMVLSLLAEAPMHGYEVMQRLEEEAGGFYSASAGSVYPVLQMLQDQGHVTSEEVEGKRVYRITEEGRRFLEENSERVDDVTDRVSDFGAAFSGRGMGDLTRSFVRLAQVSFERAMEAAGDREAVHGLQEILDRATSELEAWRRGTRKS